MSGGVLWLFCSTCKARSPAWCGPHCIICGDSLPWPFQEATFDGFHSVSLTPTAIPDCPEFGTVVERNSLLSRVRDLTADLRMTPQEVVGLVVELVEEWRAGQRFTLVVLPKSEGGAFPP